MNNLYNTVGYNTLRYLGRYIIDMVSDYINDCFNKAHLEAFSSHEHIQTYIMHSNIYLFFTVSFHNSYVE